MVESGAAVADIICIQEIRMTLEDIRVVELRWSRLGFYMYEQRGGTYHGGYGEERDSGGVMILVRKTLKQKLLFKGKTGSTQKVALRIQNLQVVGLYGPPSAVEELAAEALQAVLQLSKDDPIVMTADWNQEPTGPGSDTARVLLHQGIHVIQDDPEKSVWSTRFSGTKKLDWFASNQKCQATRTIQYEERISDHRILEITVETKLQEPESRGCLDAGPSWAKPCFLEKGEWKAMLANTWKELTTIGMVQWRSREDTEAEWEDFMQDLDALYRAAYEKALAEAEERLRWVTTTEAEREELLWQKAELQKKLRSDQVKGMEVRLWQQPEGKEPKCKNDMLRRSQVHRKAVGRISTLCGLIRKHGLAEALEVKEVRRLKVKVGLRIDWAQSQELILAELEATRCRKTRLLDELERLDQKRKIDSWKDRMVTSLKEASRWLASKSRMATRLVSGAQSRSQVCALIKDFWEAEWKEDPSLEETRKERIENTCELRCDDGCRKTLMQKRDRKPLPRMGAGLNVGEHKCADKFRSSRSQTCSKECEKLSRRHMELEVLTAIMEMR